jgi:hypothetical protein
MTRGEGNGPVGVDHRAAALGERMQPFDARSPRPSTSYSEPPA